LCCIREDEEYKAVDGELLLSPTEDEVVEIEPVGDLIISGNIISSSLV